MKRNNGFYEIELDETELLENGMLDDIFYLKDLKQRKLFLNEDIDQYSVQEIIKHILQYNCEDAGKPVEERAPILLYVNSNGGGVDAGFALIDVIKASKTPVYTINLGYQYSMGFLIGLAGHKRFATQNAKYLIHDGSNFVWNSGAKAQDQMEFYKRVDARIRQFIIQNSKINEEEYDQKLRTEWYLFADEAKEKGFTDYIIGVDCTIDDIVVSAKGDTEKNG